MIELTDRFRPRTPRAFVERVVQAALEVIAGDDTLHVVCVVPDFGTSMVGSFFSPDHERKAIEKAKDASTKAGTSATEKITTP